MRAIALCGVLGLAGGVGVAHVTACKKSDQEAPATPEQKAERTRVLVADAVKSLEALKLDEQSYDRRLAKQPPPTGIPEGYRFRFGFKIVELDVITDMKTIVDDCFLAIDSVVIGKEPGEKRVSEFEKELPEEMQFLAAERNAAFEAAAKESFGTQRVGDKLAGKRATPEEK